LNILISPHHNFAQYQVQVYQFTSIIMKLTVLVLAKNITTSYHLQE